MTMAGRRPVRLAGLALVCLIASGISGCQDPSDVTIYEPGVYKGKTDPLLALADTAEYEERLAVRFNYQRDR